MYASPRCRSLFDSADCHLRRITEDKDFEARIEQLWVCWIMGRKKHGRANAPVVKAPHALDLDFAGVERNRKASDEFPSVPRKNDRALLARDDELQFLAGA